MFMPMAHVLSAGASFSVLSINEGPTDRAYSFLMVRGRQVGVDTANDGLVVNPLSRARSLPHALLPGKEEDKNDGCERSGCEHTSICKPPYSLHVDKTTRYYRCRRRWSPGTSLLVKKTYYSSHAHSENAGQVLQIKRGIRSCSP